MTFSRVGHISPELADRRVLKRLDGSLDETVAANRSVTIRDLLTFLMGFGQMMALPDSYPILQVANAQQIGMGPPEPAILPAPDEWIRPRLGQLPLMYQPGERWMYNTGSDVLGVLIARVSSQDLETFFRERIFEPLGMQDWSSGELVVYDGAKGESMGQLACLPLWGRGTGFDHR